MTEQRIAVTDSAAEKNMNTISSPNWLSVPSILEDSISVWDMCCKNQNIEESFTFVFNNTVLYAMIYYHLHSGERELIRVEFLCVDRGGSVSGESVMFGPWWISSRWISSFVLR